MRRYLILAATLLVIATNAAATLVPINGLATGQLSDLYPTGFTPSGWVFSIWSLIYVGLIAFSIRAVVLGGRGSSDRALARLRSIELPFLVSCAANAGWIFLWHYRQIAASVVVMLLLLASLAVIYVRLRRQPASGLLERVVVDGTFSLYAGRITTATFANLGAWFFDIGSYPLGLTMDQAAIVTVVAATAIYVAVGTWTSDAVYTAVFVWASLGIVYRAEGVTEAVQLAAAAGCGAVALVTLVSAARRLFGGPQRA